MLFRSLPGKKKFGQMAVYDCDPGFTIDGSPQGITDFAIQCQVDGTFTAAPAESCQMITYRVEGRISDATNMDTLSGAQVVIKQGDLGAEFYVIVTGEAKVDIDTDGNQVTVATLKAGDYFGENALLRDEPRTATITAESQMSTLKITRDEFQRLGLHEKLQFANRKAVGGGGGLAAH